ncbi:MAG: hypothetical protein ACYC0X_19960 [Pirellulaceae bacterium]
MINGKSKFTLGRLMATSGALAALEESSQTATEFLSRHAMGDWGDELCEEDKQLNDQSVSDGSRILSAYRLSTGEKLWVITEAEDDNGHRAATTILKPDEY